MKKILLLLVLSSLSICSWSQGKRTTLQETQARVLDINPNAYVKPLTVEIEMLPTGKVCDIWTLTADQVNSLNCDLANIRSWGVFQSSKKHNCDLIVACTFDFRTDETSPNMYLLTVVGFPAKFVNWKTADESDYEWIRIEKTQTTQDIDKIKAIIK